MTENKNEKAIYDHIIQDLGLILIQGLLSNPSLFYQSVTMVTGLLQSEASVCWPESDVATVKPDRLTAAEQVLERPLNNSEWTAFLQVVSLPRINLPLYTVKKILRNQILQLESPLAWLHLSVKNVCENVAFVDYKDYKGLFPIASFQQRMCLCFNAKELFRSLLGPTS